MNVRPSSARHSSSLRKALPAFALLALLFLPGVAMAVGENLPYEDGLKKFQESLEGPVPFAISLVGIVACGAMLIFGGEISGFMRTMIFIVLVVAVIVQAGSVVSMLGGSGSLTNPSGYWIDGRHVEISVA